MTIKEKIANYNKQAEEQERKHKPKPGQTIENRGQQIPGKQQQLTSRTTSTTTLKKTTNVSRLKKSL